MYLDARTSKANNGGDGAVQEILGNNSQYPATDLMSDSFKNLADVPQAEQTQVP